MKFFVLNYCMYFLLFFIFFHIGDTGPSQWPFATAASPAQRSVLAAAGSPLPGPSKPVGQRKGGFLSSSLSMRYIASHSWSFLYSNNCGDVLPTDPLLAFCSWDTRCFSSLLSFWRLVQVDVVFTKFSLSSRMGSLWQENQWSFSSKWMSCCCCKTVRTVTSSRSYMLDKSWQAKDSKSIIYAAFQFLFNSLRDSCTSPLAVDAPLTAARRYSTSASHCSM